MASILLTLGLLPLPTKAQNDASAYQSEIGKSLNDSKKWWAPVVKPSAGSPNVVLILLDVVGFGGSSTFGGVIRIPTLVSLANNGLRYTNFHTCAICASTRSALLTGRNSHFVHEGGFSHIVMSASFPDYYGKIPSKDGTLAEILRDNGYNTFAVGKYGLTLDEDATDAGPFDRWPGGKGFEHFFDFLGSQTDQYKPDLMEDNAHVTPDGRHLNEQITDKAISYIARQQKVTPGKPFFLYYSPGAVHAPHQVDKYWSDQYKGNFDEGWDVFREKVLGNQKKLAIVPASAQLPPRNARMQEWSKLSQEQKKLFTRFMKTYAGYLTYTDYQIGRVINYLRENNLQENTIVYAITGDNVASKEGTLEGFITPRKNPARAKTQADFLKANLEQIDSIGIPNGSANYPLGWAQVTKTPFREWKQDADAEGGTRNPLIVFYPKGIKEKGGIRNQYGHVIDITPATLEFLKIKYPDYIQGVKQDMVQGTSLVYSFDNAKATSRHIVQHYYIFGSRSIYYNGWKAEAAHHPDNVDFDFKRGETVIDKSFDDDVCELYNLNEDFNERNNLAAKNPEKLAELKKIFHVQAEQNHLYPLLAGMM